MGHSDQIKKLTEERDAWRTVATALLKLVPEAEPAMREVGVLRTTYGDDCTKPDGTMSYKEYVEWYYLNFPGETPMDRNTYLTNVLGYDPPSERDYTVGDAVGLKRQPLDELKRQRLDAQSFQDAKKKVMDEHARLFDELSMDRTPADGHVGFRR